MVANNSIPAKKIKTERSDVADAVVRALNGPEKAVSASLSKISGGSEEIVDAFIHAADSAKPILHKSAQLFLAPHMAMLGVENSIRLLETIERRLGDQQQEHFGYATHLLCYFVTHVNVLAYEKLRAKLKQTLPGLARNLYEHHRCESYSIARVLLELLVSEREYLQLEEPVSVFWTREVVVNESLKSDLFFNVLLALVDKKTMKKKRLSELSEVDFEHLERPSREVEKARNELADVILSHWSVFLSASPTGVPSMTFVELLGFAIRTYAAKGELSHVVASLGHSRLTVPAKWSTFFAHMVALIQKIFENCPEECARGGHLGSLVREFVDVHEESELKSKCSDIVSNYTGFLLKEKLHTQTCGCGKKVAAILSTVTAVPLNELSKATNYFLQITMVVVLSLFQSDMMEPLKAAFPVLSPLFSEDGPFFSPSAVLLFVRNIHRYRQTFKTSDVILDSFTRLSSSLLTSMSINAETRNYAPYLFLECTGYAPTEEDYAVSAKKLAKKAASMDSVVQTVNVLEWAKIALSARECPLPESLGVDDACVFTCIVERLTNKHASDFSVFLLERMALAGREKREEILGRIFESEKRQLMMIRALTTVIDAPSGAYPGALREAVTLFWMNCLAYFSIEEKPTVNELLTWPRLAFLSKKTVALICQRAKSAKTAALLQTLPANPSGAPVASIFLTAKQVCSLVDPQSLVGVFEDQSLSRIQMLKLAAALIEAFPTSHDVISLSFIYACVEKPNHIDYEEMQAYADVLLSAVKNARLLVATFQSSVFASLLSALLVAVSRFSTEGGDPMDAAFAVKKDALARTAAKIIQIMNTDDSFSKTVPFVMSNCLMSASPSIQHSLLLLSQHLDQFGRAMLATGLPPTERLAYQRLFPYFKQANRMVA